MRKKEKKQTKQKTYQVHHNSYPVWAYFQYWLHSRIHMCREIKIRCLQNENPWSSPACPWYYAGNIKSIPRFRHLSPPKKMFFSVWSHSLPVCCIVPYWLKLDVLVMGWRNPCQWTFMGESPPFLTLSKVRLIYIFQTCSFLLRNGFSWSVGAGSLSACYHSAGTAQPSSQMAVFHRNKTYELNFISLSGLWYVESPRFISTLIPTPVYCFGSLMHEGGFRNWNLPGIYNCMFYPLLELQALFSLPPLFFTVSPTDTHTGFP